MARPKKLPDELKIDTLAFRLTPAERLRIEMDARAAGVTASEYARMQTLRGRVTVQPRQALDHDAFDQLRRIGVNLNQIARIANTTERLPAGLGRACAAVEDFLRRELDARGPALEPEPGLEPTGADEPIPPAGRAGDKPPGLDHGP